LVATIEREYKGGCTIRTVINERYDLANGVSLLAARAAVSHPFIVTMADHVLGDEIMDLAGEHTPVPGGATLLVDSRIDQVFDLDDATKVERDGTRLVAIGKQLTCYNCIDIGVFVCTDGLFEALNAVYERAGNASLSEGVAELARRGLMHTLDIGDGFWQDVDTPQMLAHAAQMLTARH
jgi:choline kinase